MVVTTKREEFSMVKVRCACQMILPNVEYLKTMYMLDLEIRMGLLTLNRKRNRFMQMIRLVNPFESEDSTLFHIFK